jgi:hypothetical protein
MSHFVNFRGYGVHGREVEVAVARITHFWQVEINGYWCVEIQLDTGKVVTVVGFVSEVKAKLDAVSKGDQ